MPSAVPTGATWSYGDPVLDVRVTFAVDMDQTVQPLASELVITVDGAPHDPSAVNWDDATHLDLEYSEALLGPTDVELAYPAMFPNFLSLQGQPVFPFDIIVPPL